MTTLEITQTPANVRMAYAGAIALLAEVAVHIRGPDAHEHRDNIERAIHDWCDLTGWSFERTLDRFDLYPPE